MSRPNIVLLADRTRPGIEAVLDEVRCAVAGHVEIVGELDANGDPLPDDLDAQMAIAVGGDGTLISQARRIVERDLPLVGVNVGRLGFLAAFDAQTLAEHAAVIFGPDPPVQHRLLLHATVRAAGGATLAEGIAVNDFVVSGGPSLRMVDLRLWIDGAQGPALSGDGVVVATPVGSTAYSVSAGGPIVHPALDALVITPLAAHSLAFRPLVLRDGARLRIEMIRAHGGTSLVRDGRVFSPAGEGTTIDIRRHDRKATFVVNPGTTYWRVLQDKLRWGSAADLPGMIPPAARPGRRGTA